MSRCPACLREIAAETCPHCGYPGELNNVSRFVLPVGTKLHGRYQLGMCLTSGYQSMAYVAADLQTGKPVIVTELFPRNLGGRAGNRVGVRKNQTQFAAAVSGYLAARLNVPYPLVEAFAENDTAYRAYELPDGAESAPAAADLLLDHPVYFRDGSGKPLMSVNALTIPALPRVRQWRRCAPLPNDDHTQLGRQAIPRVVYKDDADAGEDTTLRPRAAEPTLDPVPAPVPQPPAPMPMPMPSMSVPEEDTAMLPLPEEAAPRPVKKKRLNALMLLCLAAVLLVGGLLLFFSMNRRNNDAGDRVPDQAPASLTELSDAGDR